MQTRVVITAAFIDHAASGFSITAIISDRKARFNTFKS